MTTTWRTGIDWDRDRFICWDARPGDALNLLPTPLTYSDITWRTNSADVVSLVSRETDYGTSAFYVEADTIYHGLVIGATNSDVADSIPVQPSTTYKVAAWVRGVSGYSGVPTYMNAYDEDGIWLGAFANIDLTADWQKVTWQFTTTANSQYVKLAHALNAAPAGTVAFETTGWLLVQGTLPNGFNAGEGSNLYDNITASAISAKWALGMRKPYQETVDNLALELVLSNADKLYSPENTSSPLNGKIVPLRPVRIQSNDGTTTRTHWVGWIAAIEPMAGQFGQRQVRITAAGPMQFYKAAETKLALQENKRTDQIIADLIKEVVMPPSMSEAWVLGRVGNGELGHIRLADTSAYSTLDTGILTLKIAAENWVRQGGFTDVIQDSFDVYHAIGDIIAAERGKFLFDREGKALFWNRHHLLQGGNPMATFDDSMIGMEYTFAGLDQLKNEVLVVAHPRTISSVATDVLWELGDAIIRVDAGKDRTIYVKYEDENDKRTGARDVTVGDLEFEEGSAAATIEAKANGAELTFTNTGTVAAIIKKCVVKGRKISDSGAIEAKAIDQGSIVDYGRRTLRINLPSIDSLEQAQYIADFERDRRKDPKGEVTMLAVASQAVKGGGHHAQQLELTLGDLIQVEETQTGHAKQHTIIGESHELTDGLTQFKTMWYLEPAPEVYPWKLDVEGRMELGTNTRLAY